MLADLYFVNAQFGASGLRSYQIVLNGLLARLIKADVKEVDAFIDGLKVEEGNEGVGKADLVFWTLCVEGLMEVISDGYIREKVLPTLHP